MFLKRNSQLSLQENLLRAGVRANLVLGQSIVVIVVATTLLGIAPTGDAMGVAAKTIW